jgi:FKBP-type peptidyl-prolyl cis-trans isomerase 2
MAIEAGDEVTFEYVARTAGGEVFDTSRQSVAPDADVRGDRRPLTVTVGTGELIEGLDEALIGMAERETATVTVPPEKAYGEWSEDRVVSYHPKAFRGMLDGAAPEVGKRIRLGQGQVGEVVHADEETVRIDCNHEMAGETVEFEIEIIEVA